MTLSIIIVNYNVKFFLEQCLTSVERAIQGIDAEVFVVDNTSSDGSDVMMKHRFPWVKYIYNTENVGFSKANNQAIHLSKGKYVLLLNPDTIVQEETFSSCIEFMDKHPEAGSLGIKMIDGAGNFLPESKRGLPSPWVAFTKLTGLSKLFSSSETFGKYHLTYLSKEEINEIDVLAGAYMFMRKEALDKSGLLDETFFMYGEDIDLSYRILLAGYKNYYFPHHPIIHYKGESTKKGSLNYVFIFYEAMVIFAKKHFGGGGLGLFIFLINIAIYLRATFSILKRALQFIRLPLIDFASIYLVITWITHYWELNHKYVKLPYPAIYLSFVVPLYIVLWMLGAYLYGTYRSSNSIFRLIKGIGVGTALIAIIYAFVPESFRFSRALIVLDAIAAFAIMASIRAVLNYIKSGKFAIDISEQRHRIAVVGNSDSIQKVQSILGPTKSELVIGFIAEGKEDKALGSLKDLMNLSQSFEINELIFDANAVSHSTIISTIEKLQGKNILIKTLPLNAQFIIGSDSTETQGSSLTNLSHFALSNTELRDAKYLWDKLIALLLILFSPLALCFGSTRKLLLVLLRSRQSCLACFKIRGISL
jgi:O-antigen biosynthesis protein